MGRVARAIVHAALDDAAFETTLLLERPGDERGVRDAFAPREIALAGAGDARRPGRFDVAWFPWNGMRYAAAAPSLLTINDAFAFTFAHPSTVARMREQAPIRRGARAATRIATCSRWSRSEIVRTLDVAASAVELIPYAPDPLFVPPAEPVPSDGTFVLLVGARERRKNARTIIDACATAFGERDALFVVGDLSDDDVRHLTRTGIPHRMLGVVNDETLLGLYQGARAVVVPSLAEGFGLVAVEAMACGAATLVADFSALREAANDAALVLDPLDVAAWSDALTRVLRDDGLHGELVRRAGEWSARCDRTLPARDYLALLRRVAAL